MNKKLYLSLVVSALVVTGCGNADTTASTPQFPLVSVQDVTLISHQRSKQYIGRVHAIDDVTITAQVSGYLKSRHFVEGELVEKGQLLYQIEPSSFEAQVASANASIAQAKANLKKAELDLTRAKNLLPKGNISQSEFDALTAAQLGAKAQLKASEAELKLAEVNLSYTQITAPFDGRISETYASIGDLVSPSSGILTSIVNLDPIYTNFNVSERERLLMGMEGAKGDGSGAADDVDVEIVLESNQSFEHLGKIDYIANRIDLQTGTLAMRAVVANPNYELLPGQHVKVSIKERETTDAISIPRRAVQTDLEGDFVMVLREGNVAERINIELGKQVESGIIVQEGLEPEDVIITKGLQRVRNGMEVKLDATSSKLTSEMKGA